MKNLLPLVLPLLLALPFGLAAARAGDPAPRPPGEVAERIFREALTARRSYALLTELTEAAPHRLSGSPGSAAAVAWAKRAMEEAGLVNVRLEPVTVPVWVRGQPEVLRFDAPESARSEPLPVLALGGSVGTPADGITAAVLVVSSFDDLEARAAEAKGRIVLFDAAMDSAAADPFRAYGDVVRYRVGGASAAAKAGAVAALIRSITTSRDDVPHTGGMRYEEGVARIPVAAVSPRAVGRIADRVGRGEEVRLHLRMSCEMRPDAESANVLGELTGRELPEEIVLVGAHLDAWDTGQGAHDDGAGCAQAIEAAALLGRLDLVPRRTIRVVLFANEENGLRGGRAYAKAHADELSRHVMALESDRGGFAPRGFAVQGSEGALSAIRGLATVLDRWGAGVVRAGGAGADISPMRAAGVPLIGYLPDASRYFDVHHAPTDVLAAVSDRELELGTAAIATLLHAVAERTEPLPRTSRPEVGK